tara:strand:- start:1400 stop:2350 length:951 start_codon:yes stop_codon:yes gene_type:complete
VKKICFIPDYSKSTGRGHLGRCINLAYTFKQNKWDVFFYFEKRHDINKSTCKFKIIKTIKEKYFNLIFVDSYFLNNKKIIFYKKISEKICVIDDFGVIKYKTDFYLNYSSNNPKNPKKIKNIKKLLGFKYLIQSPLNKNPKIRKIFNFNKEIPIAIFFSSTCKSNLLFKVLKILSLSKFYEFMKIELLLTSEMNFSKKTLMKLKNHKKIKLTIDKKDLYKTYQYSYFFIGSYGYSLLERIGFSAISVCNLFIKNQKQNYNFLKNKGIVINIESISKLNKVIDDLIKNPKKINRIQKNKILKITYKGNQNIFNDLIK